MGVSFLQQNSNTTTQTTYTFASENLGVADAGRYIIVGIVARKAGTGGAISTVTIGGVSADIVCQSTVEKDGNSQPTGLAIAAVPTGTTGDVVVTLNTAHLRMGIGLWRATGLVSATPYNAQTDNQDDPAVNLRVPYGFAIGVSSGAGGSSATWTGLTEDYDVAFHAFLVHSGASQTFNNDQSVVTLADWTASTNSVGAFASWQLINEINPLYIKSLQP